MRSRERSSGENRRFSSVGKRPEDPFHGLLGTVKEIEASLGPRPSPKAVQEAAARLTDEAGKLAP